MHLIIFDIDGTLSSTNAIDVQYFPKAFEETLGIREVDTDWANYTHCTDSCIMHEAIERAFDREAHHSEVNLVREAYCFMVNDHADRFPDDINEIPGAVKMMQHLRQNTDYALAIATGGWSCSALVKLAFAGIPVDGTPIATADDGFSRVDILNVAVQRALMHNRVNSFERIISVGDGTWDVRTAKALGYEFIGITQDSDEQLLRSEGAEKLLPDYRGLEQFLELLIS